MILLRRHLNDMNEIVLRANIIFLRILSSHFQYHVYYGYTLVGCFSVYASPRGLF